MEVENVSQVIIFDGDSQMTQILKNRLKQAGFTWQIFKDEAKLFEALGKSTAELIILEPNGLKEKISSILTIRKMSNQESTPILILSVLAKDIDIFNGYYYGADFYCTKPCNLEEVIDNVKRLLKKPTAPSA